MIGSIKRETIFSELLALPIVSSQDRDVFLLYRFGFQSDMSC